MKYSPFLLALLLIFLSAGAQKSQLTGHVFELNSGKAMISGVSMWAERSAANRVITKNDGAFTLTFQDMQAGKDIYLRADKTGWAVVNEMEMNTRIPIDRYEKPMQVYIYIRYKDKPLQFATFKTFFLADLDKLEQAGITHKNFTRVRKLLQ